MKLVRDNIGDIAWRYPDSKAALRPVKDVDEHIDLLHAKLLEEVGELILAKSRDEVLSEVADLTEAVRALVLIRTGYTTADIEAARALKYRTRGGFDRGTVWDV